MTAAHSQQSAVLYQSADGEITLVDIPTSILTAQGRTGTLLSSLPLEEPIRPSEDYQPRSSKTAGIAPVGSAYFAVYKSLIQQALLDIKAHVSGSWCTPRQILANPSERGIDGVESNDAERTLELQFREWAAVMEDGVDDNSFDFQTMMASLGAPEVQAATRRTNLPQWKMSYSASEDAESQEASVSDWSPAFYNAEDHPLNLTVYRARTETEQINQAYNFTLPPLSAFFLGDCDHPDSFRSFFRKVTDEHNLPRHFDLVLLDPPWPNRSAKRKGAYDQIGGMPYLKRMLLKMDIDNYLEHNALVGIWITNKSALRDHVLGPGGLFETWNVGLVEEWVWVKTTTKGEPMFDIDDAMRKPYEVLLLGRAAPNAWTTMTHAANPRKRVIAAVPDIHSRKPCLKELLEPYMPDSTDYSALEVFARYLVAGWMSWGNEVLKYNSNIYWAAAASDR